MRAVNLIPLDQRRGGDAPSRAGVGAYGALAALGLAVLLVGAYVFTSNSVTDNRARLVEVGAQAGRIEAQAEKLRPYYEFAVMRQRRVATVRALAANRFDWERSLRQLARVIPSNVFITKFLGTVAPGVTVDGISISDPANVRSKVAAPAFQIVGCTDEQRDVARIMSRLRRMTGVTNVTLSASEKPLHKKDAVTSPQLSEDPDCRFDASIPKFTITVFYRPLPPGPALEGAPGAAAPGSGATPVANQGGSR